MRYAIYYTPSPDSALLASAKKWIGRDAFNSQKVPTSAAGDLSAERVYDISAFPRHYGFHATLKAPFELIEGQTEVALSKAIAAFATTQKCFNLPSLKLANHHNYLALMQGADCAEIKELAANCVKVFEPYRAELSEADIARRNPDALSERQREYLMKWGYPSIFEEFHFHLTLSRKLEAKELDKALDAAASHFSNFIGQDLEIGGLGLFRQKDRQSPFTVDSYYPFLSA